MTVPIHTVSFLVLLVSVLCIGNIPPVFGQPVSVFTSNVTVAYLQQGALECNLVGYTGGGPVSISIEKTSEDHSSALFSVESFTATLTVIASQYNDTGEYTCRVVIFGASSNITLSSNFYFQVEEQFVFLSQPMDQLDIPLATTARFLCHPNLGQLVLWRINELELEFDNRIEQFNLGITINDVTYSDAGRYTCVVAYMGMLKESSAEISIQGYEAPSGSVGFGFVKSSETPVLTCTVEGVPGPIEFYWQKGEDVNAARVTTRTNMTTGPFVDSMGRLDLTRAQANDTDFYRCTGIDETGASAFQLFRVEIVVGDGFVLWTQWYFILLYCVIGVVLIAMVVLVIWCCYSTRRHWWVKVTKIVMVKKRVRRHQRVQKMPLDEDIEAIDDYAK